MLACAAIQKLERYGQLGWKRSSLEDFVLSSLRDAKRANIYALTHLSTWQECYSALNKSSTPARAPAAGDGEERCVDASFAGGADATVSESLVYAMSFATALITYHVHAYLGLRHGHCRSDRAAEGEKCRGDDDGGKGKKRKAANAPVEAVAAEYVFSGEGLSEAAELLKVLRDIATTMAKNPRCCRHSHSTTFTQALAHLLSSIASLQLFLHVTLLSSGSTKDSDMADKQQPQDLLASMYVSGIALEIAVSRQLRRAMAQYPVEMLLHARTCTAQLKQQLNKKASPQAATAVAASRAQTEGASPLTSVLLECALGDSFAVFDGLTLFQKLSLSFSLTLAAPAPDLLRSSNSATAATPAVVSPVNAHELCAELRVVLCALLSPTACNRATRYVVYYRGDDVRLLQSNVRQASDYALHTYVTSPPIEDSMLQLLSEMITSTGATNERTRRRCALVLAQWVTSIPFFYQSFCWDSSWTAFAQEQRRAALLRQSQTKRTQRDARKRRREEKKKTMGSGSRSSSSSSSASLAGSSDGTASVSSHSTNGIGHARHDGNDDDRRSEITQHSALLSTLTMESRVSLLSTLSKHSAASYLSFLSVLKPEGGGVDGTGNATEDEHKLHESADGNTNLPLILLEDLVLGLHRLLEVAPATVLDTYDLRALCWETIGNLFEYVQATLRAGAEADDQDARVLSRHHHRHQQKQRGKARAALTPLFNLGQDLRYNRGLGYESLGMLFAKVVAPELEKGAATSLSSLSSSPDGASLGSETIRRIEAALSQCLSAYETVAPQVVDMNLPVILRIAARTAHLTTNTAGSNDDIGGTEVLHRFIASVVRRLGKSNQIALLFDALAIHTSQQHPHPDGVPSSSSHPITTTRGAAAEDNSDDVTALQLTFSHPIVRGALLEACAVSMDPENLLRHLVQHISSWSEEEEASRDTAPGGGHDPLGVLFTMQLVATVVEGVVPTSVTSTAVLERSTELELLLSSFFIDRLYKPFFGSPSTGDSDDDEEGCPFFTGGSGRLRHRTLLRRLVLHILHAIYQTRRATEACLRDLGLQGVEAYISMLEDTLWQVGTQVGALVGPLGIAELEQTLTPVTATATTTAITRLPYAPYVSGPVLLAQIAVQRLALARSVTTVLGTTAGPAAEAKGLAQCVMHALQGGADTSAAKRCPGAARQALELANSISEEGWVSLVLYGKARRARESLVALMRLTLSATATSMRLSLEAADTLAPVWLARCLRCVSGVILRAITDVFVSLSSDDVVSLVHGAQEGEDQTTEPAACLPALLGALQEAYATVGHIPYWPMLMDHASAWLIALRKAAAGKTTRTAAASSGALTSVVNITSPLLAFALCCIGTESRAQDVLRRALLRSDTGIRGQGDESVVEGERSAAATSASSNGKSLSPLYVNAIGVPVTLLSDLRATITAAPTGAQSETAGEGGDDEAEPIAATAAVVMVNEMCFDDELQSLAKTLFSKKFMEALLFHNAAEVAASPASDHAHTAMHLLSSLYTICLSATQVQWRQDPASRASAQVLQQSPAFLFITHVATHFSVADHRSAAALSLFLQSTARGAAAALLPPQRLVTPDSTTDDVFAPVERLWVAVLRGLLIHLLSPPPTTRCDSDGEEDAGRLHAGVLRVFNLLFHSLLVNVSGRRKRQRTAQTEGGRDRMKRSRAAADASADGCGDGGGGGNDTIILLAQLLVPQTPEEASDAGNIHDKGTVLLRRQLRALLVDPLDSDQVDGTARGEEGVAIALHLLAHNGEDGVVAAWYILWIAEGVTGAHGDAPVIAEGQVEGDDTACAAAVAKKRRCEGPSRSSRPRSGPPPQANAVIAVLSSYDAAATATPNARDVLSSYRAGRASHPQLLLMPVTAAPNSRAEPCSSDAAAGWLMAALGALPRVLQAQLVVMSGAGSESIAFNFMHSVLSQSVPATPQAFLRWVGDDGVTEERVARGHALLMSTAAAVQQLSAVSGFRFSVLMPYIRRLLWVSTQPAMLTHMRRSSQDMNGPPRVTTAVTAASSGTLWASLIALCGAPAPALLKDDAFTDCVWQFLTTVIGANYHRPEPTTASSAAVLATSSADDAASTAQLPPLTESEVSAVLQLLSRAWLASDTMWRRPAMVAPVLSGLFSCVLCGVREGLYTRRVLNQLSSFFYQMTRHVEGKMQPRQNDRDDGSRANANVVERHAHSPRSGTSKSAQYLCLTAITSNLFEVAQHYVSIFTAHSNDLDYVAADFLKTLSRQHLPRPTAPPIPYHQGVTIRHPGPAEHTLSDLAFSSVANADSKALLRQAALRIEEEAEEGVGGAGDGVGASGRRHIFRVDE